MERDIQEARLNEIADQWARLEPEGNEAARQTLYIELFTLAFQLYDTSGAMWVVDAFEEAIEKFDPARALFSHYFAHLLKKRRIDAHRYEQRHSPTGISLDDLVGKKDQVELGKLLEDIHAENPEHAIMKEFKFLELTSMILNFTQCHLGKSGNEIRRNWYRIFYTEDITDTLKTKSLRFVHERDVFAAINQSYLDYYMSAPCTTMKQIQVIPLRPYCQVVPEREGRTEETPVPIPSDVSLSYLRRCEGKRVGKSTRSNQMKFYEEEKKLMRSC